MSIKDKVANAKEVDIFAELPPREKRRCDLMATIAITAMLNGKKERPFWLMRLLLRIMGC